MINISIPGRGEYTLTHLVLDLNGTIALDGRIVEGVEARLRQLSTLVEILLVTADTYGTASRLSLELPVKILKIEPGREQFQKLQFVQGIGSSRVVAIGNGANDSLMLSQAGIGICVIGPEGASAQAVASCDLVSDSINNALDLMLNPARIIATLRR